MPFCVYAGCHFWLNSRESALRLYAGCYYVYMPDATFALTQNRESALCLYAGCHSVCIPDVTLVTKQTLNVHCVYVPDVNLFIFPNYIAPRMQLFVKQQ